MVSASRRFFPLMRRLIEIFICTCLSWSAGAGTRFASACIRSISRTMAIFTTFTTTKLRHSLAGSLVFSAAWMASFSVLEIEYMAHNDLREHRVRGELRGYDRER